MFSPNVSQVWKDTLNLVVVFTFPGLIFERAYFLYYFRVVIWGLFFERAYFILFASSNFFFGGRGLFSRGLIF